MGFLFELETSHKIDRKIFYACSLCPLNTKSSTKVEPTGSANPILYFCGEAPGEQETLWQKQFVGRAGQRLRKTLYSIIDEKFEQNYIRWNNVVKCRPPENRTPNSLEIDCCSTSLIEDISETKPIVVVTFGSVATELFLKINDLFNVTGRFFPMKIGNHACYVYPMYHPSFLIRNVDSDKLYDSFFDACFRKLFDELPHLEMPDFSNNFYKDIIILHNDLEIKENLNSLDKTVALDLETNGLRPFSGHRIVSVAIADKTKTIVFPFNDATKIYLEKFMIDKTIITHNLKFELEWLSYYLSKDIIYKNEWHDTMVLAYILDFRKPDKYSKTKGSFNLDFLILLHFGFSLKSLSPDVNRKEINRFSDSVALYNALDAKFTYKLFFKQSEKFNKNLYDVYNKTIEVTKSIVLCQNKGLCFDVDYCNTLYKKYSIELENIETKLASMEEIQKFEKSTGTRFDVLSPRHIATVLTNFMSEELKRTKKGNFSTDDESLMLLKRKGNKLADYILNYRQLYKFKSTYLENALKLNINNTLFTNYNICFTATGRLSSGSDDEHTSNYSLNFQNFPRNSIIRDIIKAPEDCYFVACDYSQLEVRVIAMLSGDTVLQEEIRKGIDIHQLMTNEFINHYPKLANYDIKELRNFVKSTLVFGTIYGSSEDSTIRRFRSEYNIPNIVTSRIYNLFIDKYYGLKQWQDRLISFYKKNGYIESPTHRRWFAPLSVRQIVNYIIQSVAAFDICASAGARLSRLSIEKPYLQYIMNIHDDLSFYIPREKLEEATKEIAFEMTKKIYEWQTLPLKVKISIGKSWGSLQEMFEASLDDDENVILKKLS